MTGLPTVVVDDVDTAFVALGASARGRVPDRVAGITGSVGKTSTKDLAAAILRRRYVTTANEMSFNNEFLAAGIDACQTEFVTIQTSDPGKLAVIRPKDDTAYTYLLMPLRS